MRVSVQPPHEGPDHRPLTYDEIAANARLIEDVGFNGIWKGHHVPVPGDPQRSMPDPLIHLMLAGMATERVELGTCIYCVPLGNAAELAQRVYTMQAFVPGRFTFGVGTGSQAMEYEHAGLEWKKRFSRLDSHMAYIRSIYETKPSEHVEKMFTREGAWSSAVEQPKFVGQTAPMQLGMPRTILGAWLSEPQLRRAVAQYDGWMGSGGPGTHYGGWPVVVRDSIKRYRDMGGKRAMLTTVMVDLSAPEADLEPDGSFHLVCGPKSAAERLNMLQEFGYDDVILSLVSAHGHGAAEDFTRERLEEIRSLVPLDDSDYH